MKKTIILTALLTALLLFTSLVSGCGVILVPEDGETESGQMETRQYDFTDFNRVDIGSAFEYEIRQADTYSISITADSNVFDDLRIERDGQTLDIGVEFPGISWTFFSPAPKLRAVITMPQLRGLDSSGATDGVVTGFYSDEDLDVVASGASTVELVDIAVGKAFFKVSGASTVEFDEFSMTGAAFDISGASTVTGDIEAADLEMEVSGASTVELEGSADRLTVDGSGASHLELEDLALADAGITLSGASDATVNLGGRLDAELSGASTLEYIGEPALGDIDVTGASSLEQK